MAVVEIPNLAKTISATGNQSLTTIVKRHTSDNLITMSI
jgi:hypothetical protein